MTNHPVSDSRQSLPSHWAQQLAELIQSKGGDVSPVEFQHTVNVVFHDVEARHYDALHDEMWQSLPPIFQRIAETIRQNVAPSAKLIVADIGCGTGLSAHLLHAAMADLIDRFILVDTSSVMLDKCRQRAKAWNVPCEFHCGLIDTIPRSSVDLVMTSSVLHHIPDIGLFCGQVARITRENGFFCHLQDPRNAAADHLELLARRKTLAAIREEKRLRNLKQPRVFRLIRSLHHRIKRYLDAGYLRDVNRQLRRMGVIKNSLTSAELWSVTDCHIGGLPFAAGDGIDIHFLGNHLTLFSPVRVFSYGFFGELKSNLPANLQGEEDRLFAQEDHAGLYCAGVWKRPPRG